jgi:hypothetical protein
MRIIAPGERRDTGRADSLKTHCEAAKTMKGRQKEGTTESTERHGEEQQRNLAAKGKLL